MDMKQVLATGAVTLILLGVFAGGTVSAQSEGTPDAEATGEMLFELTVPGEALPEDIHWFNVGDVTVAAGVDVSEGDESASQANESMRAVGLLVERGELLFEPTSDAFVWREAAATPEVAMEGATITLLPGEAIFLPAMPAAEADPEKYLHIASPGSEGALVSMFHVHTGDQHFGGYPQGVNRVLPYVRAGYPGGFAAFEGVDVLFRLTRWTGEPGAEIPLAGHPALAVYIVESGTLEETAADADGETTDAWAAGTGRVMPIVEGVERRLVVAGGEAASVVEWLAIPQAD